MTIKTNPPRGRKRTKHKGRKPGDWKAVAAMKLRSQRDLINGRGLSNIPHVGDVGSAAYRRLRARGRKAA